MKKLFKNGNRVYIRSHAPFSPRMDVQKTAMIYTRDIGVELMPRAINEVKLLVDGEPFIVNAFDLIRAINEAIEIQRGSK